MSQPPTVIVFDVNETLSDTSPLKTKFDDVGAPEYLADLWFAGVLRDGFALAAAGTREKFSAIADGVLRNVLNTVPLNRRMDDAVEHVLQGFGSLPVHPDVVDGVTGLKEAGARLITLTNGAVAISEQLLTSAGVRNHFETLLSVEDAATWKPARASYEYAANSLGENPANMLLVAVHPWDIDGASRAGFQTAWVNRTGAEYPAHFSAPDFSVTAITELAAAVGLTP
ncbi:haloacid dehalogenase type II [Arthrobacter monumenti]